MSLPATIEGKTSEIFRQSTTKGPWMLGTEMVFPDGRRYKRMKAAAAAIGIGKVIGAAQVSGIDTDSDVVVMEARTTAQWDDGDLTVRILTTGSTSTTTQNIVANEFSDGYLWVNDEDGEGQILQIKSHGGETVTGSTGGLDITMYEEELLTIALTTASQVGLKKNAYNDVVVHINTTAGGKAIGVAPIAVSASNYFWGQVWGPCPVLSGEQVATAGQRVGVLNDTGGSTLAEAAGTIYPMGSTKVFDTYQKNLAASEVGYCLMVPTGDAEYGLYYLTIG